jgi:peroxiredoxin
MMVLRLFAVLVASSLVLVASARPVRVSAELKPGVAAPLFSTQASLGGKVFGFDLAEALAKGPVVLYFYPAAFTSGCTFEAHDFAEHIPDYQKLGATVIGVSGDDIGKLQKFSVSECRSKFAVAADQNHKISKSYDATIGFGPIMYSDRTSYVISQAGKVVFSYRAMDPSEHVARTLAALKDLEVPPATAKP